MARDYFHAGKNYEVIGGYLSPVSDGYKKKGLLPAHYRIGMCQEALEDSDWLALDTWEAEQSEWTRTCVVLQSLQDRLNQKEIVQKYTGGRPIKVMLVSGGDLVGSFLTPGLWDPEDVSISFVCFLFLVFQAKVKTACSMTFLLF
jgi:nicotinamide mononucleotide adenylyltransferase